MSNVMISLLLAAGGGGWLYFRFASHTGTGNNKPAAIGALVSAIIIFIVVFITISTFFKK